MKLPIIDAIIVGGLKNCARTKEMAKNCGFFYNFLSISVNRLVYETV